MPRAVTDLARVSRGLVLLVALSGACAPAEVAPVRAPETPARAPATPPRSSTARLVCRALGPRELTRALSEQARAELEASRDGEHFVSERFEPAMARLREAALGGERLAQAVYGTTRFGTLMSYEAPRAEQRELYVEALAFWRTAALAEPEPDPSGITAATPEGLDAPLSELPPEWLHEAWARADDWIRCHGLPW